VGGDTPDESGEAVGRSYVCAGGWELRITERCLTEDLRLAPDATFAEATAHEIVVAFRNKRGLEAVGSGSIGPAAGDDTIRPLRYTHRHRGATWYDTEQRVAWLCGYGYHESGATDDAFQHFRELMDERRLLPTEAERAAVDDDRADRLAAALPAEAQTLLAKARASPLREIGGTLGSRGVGVVVVIDDAHELIYVAITGATKRETNAILNAFDANAEIDDWSFEYNLPTRDLNWEALEICRAIIYEI
jgi:hypothetical protein